MLTYRTGAAGAVGAAGSMASHLLEQTLTPEHAAIAQYYQRGLAGQPLNRGPEELREFERAGQPRQQAFSEDQDGSRELGDEQARPTIFDSTVPEPRRNMDPRLAELLGIDLNRPPTRDEIAELLAGNRADGIEIAGAGHRQRYDNRAKVSYIDLCWSADKSVSLAWAFAPTHAERNIIMQAHKDAVESAMEFVEREIGRARRGAAGSKGFENGAIGWVAFDHYAARPTIEIARVDANGAAYTDLVTLKVAGDPQLHTHVAVPNAVLTTGGHLGSLDLLGLESRVHEFGAYYQAHLATNLRRNGIEVGLDDRTGAARLPSVPAAVRSAYSKRTRDAEGAARDYAAKEGIDWDTLNGDRRAGLLKTAAFQTRRSKETGSPGDDTGDFAAWQAQASALGWSHRSLIRAESTFEQQTRSARLEVAYQASLNFVERELDRRAVLESSDVRLAATRGLVASGISGPSDIDAVTRAMRERGVRQAGEHTFLAWGEEFSSSKGRPRVRITTALHESQERQFVETVRNLHARRAHALTDAELTAAISRINRSRAEQWLPVLDFSTEHGSRQLALARSLGMGGDYELGIGVAGSGKTAIFQPLVEAYRSKGYDVIGTALAWRQTDDLAVAGIGRRFALAKLLSMERTGALDLRPQTVIFVDEYSLIGTKNGLALAQIAERYGCKIINVGDMKQCQSIEAGPLIDLARRALGTEAVPELLLSIRQEMERERQTALLFRDGDAAAAIEIKLQDGTAQLIPGGQRQMLEHVASLWEQRRDANRHDAQFTLTVSAPTNEDARNLAAAIRERKQALDEIGPTLATLAATDQMGAEFSLALAVGDRVRLFDRVVVPDGEGTPAHIGNNGTVVEVRGLDKEGILLRSTTGAEGNVPWDKLRDSVNGRVRLTYGDALSIDATQGLTTTEHINALPSGSRAITGFKAYVAESRHRRATWLIVSDGAERREIMSRRPIGDMRPVTAGDVWENVARNMARQPEKASALAFLDRALKLRRSSVHALQEALQPIEQRASDGRGGPQLHERFSRTRDIAVADRVGTIFQQFERRSGSRLQQLKRLAPSVARAMSVRIQHMRPMWQVLARSLQSRADREREWRGR